MPYVEISNITFTPQTPEPNTRVDINVVIRNTSGVPLSALVDISYNAGGIITPVVYDNSPSVTLQAGETYIAQAHFTMPNQNVVLISNSYYYASDSQWHKDQTATQQVLVSGGGQETFDFSGYSIKQHVAYPAAGTYTGVASTAIATFTVPFTVIPGVAWLVENTIGRFIQGCNQNGVTPLYMKVYTRPAPLGSTDYAMEFCGHGSPIALPVWIAIIVVALGVVAVTFRIAATVDSVFGPDKSETTTTTEAQEKDVSGAGSLSNISGGTITFTDGGGGAVVTSASGSTTKISPGGTVALGTGATVAYNAGGHFSIPAQTTTTKTSTSNADQLADIFKYAAIGLGIAVIGFVVLPQVMKLIPQKSGG